MKVARYDRSMRQQRRLRRLAAHTMGMAPEALARWRFTVPTTTARGLRTISISMPAIFATPRQLELHRASIVDLVAAGRALV